MATPTRILYVAGEVAPFSETTEIAPLVRSLAEQLQEQSDHDVRITMPRYGTVSERKNRLHEVIRLSGTEIPMGDDESTLKVKVASIPSTRLQVYFMDSKAFFGRKGLHVNKKGNCYEDNAERALFYGRSVLETIKKLRWGPDLVHAFGWVSGFVPMLLRTEYGSDELFESTRVVYTPDAVDAEAHLTADLVDALDLQIDRDVLDRSLVDVGTAYADHAVFPATIAPVSGEASQFSEDEESLGEQGLTLYDEVLNTVPA